MYSIDPKTGKRLYTLKKVAPDGKASTSAHPGTCFLLIVSVVCFFIDSVQLTHLFFSSLLLLLLLLQPDSHLMTNSHRNVWHAKNDLDFT